MEEMSSLLDRVTRLVELDSASCVSSPEEESACGVMG